MSQLLVKTVVDVEEHDQNQTQITKRTKRRKNRSYVMIGGTVTAEKKNLVCLLEKNVVGKKLSITESNLK